MEWQKDGFLISTEPARIDIEAVHACLTNSYWAAGVPIDVVRRSIQHALCFGIYKDDKQAGFARVITDYATFAYIGDVFVLEKYRGLGLSKWLMNVIRGHPDLSGFRVWMLATRDAHGLYSQFGFAPLRNPTVWMEIRDLEVYKR